MGFYLNLTTLGLHNDQCNTAIGRVAAAKAVGDDSNWPWFESYTHVFLKAKRERLSLAPHSVCDPQPDAVDRRIIALYEALRPS